jgi:biopolymer transport protein ExbD
LKLPAGGRPEQPLSRNDVRTVEISAQGVYMLNRQRISLPQMEAQLLRDAKANPNLVINIRADENGRNKDLYAVVDMCQRNGLTRFSLRTESPNQR